MATTTPRTILEIVNRHTADLPELDLEPDDFTAYFENEDREQWVFVRRSGADHGTVYGGRDGWAGTEVRVRDTAADRAALLEAGVDEVVVDIAMELRQPDPLVEHVLLGTREKAWLNLAWAASSSQEERDAAVIRLAKDLAAKAPADELAHTPGTPEHRAVMQSLALLVGHAAGSRGMASSAAAHLYLRVLDELDRR